MKSVKLSRRNFFICIFLVIETILLKVFQYNLLPEKYFYDSQKILRIMGGSSFTDKAYTFTAEFYKKINIFGLSSIVEWSIFISIIFLIIFILIFSKRVLEDTQVVYVFVSFALMNIFVFNISKDAIQLSIFLIIYLFFVSSKIDELKKVIIASVILMIESFYFRTYYLLMGILVISFYIIFKFFFYQNNHKKGAKKTGKMLLLFFLFFMVLIFILQKMSSENYNLLINARSSSNLYRDNTDTTTIINDLFNNTNFGGFIINYIVNSIRIMLPLELLTKGIKYVPFILYQLFFSFILFRNIKRINISTLPYLAILVSFIMVSIIFEPDYGSLIRHESVLMLFVLQLINGDENEKSICNNSNI